jgi:hypothetical protein
MRDRIGRMSIGFGGEVSTVVQPRERGIAGLLRRRQGGNARRCLLSAATALVAATVMVGCGSSGGAASTSAKTTSTTLYFYGVAGSTSVENAAGQPIPPSVYNSSSFEPAVGDTFDDTTVNYVGTNVHHASKSTASTHLGCMVTSTTGGATCNVQVAIGGALLISYTQAVNLSNQAHTTFNINQGTGKYEGAQGTLAAATAGTTNNQNFTISLRY